MSNQGYVVIIVAVFILVSFYEGPLHKIMKIIMGLGITWV